MPDRLLGKVLILFVLAFVLAGCGGSKPIALEGVEIREYQGIKLSSVNDFRENSIAGPQYVS